MAHFAKLDENDIVLEVHVVNNDVLDSGNEETSGIAFLTQWSGGHQLWAQCSYNGSFRKNYPGIGYIFDRDRDAFIPPQCHAEAVLNETLCSWTCQNYEHEELDITKS